MVKPVLDRGGDGHSDREGGRGERETDSHNLLLGSSETRPSHVSGLVCSCQWASIEHEASWELFVC